MKTDFESIAFTNLFVVHPKMAPNGVLCFFTLDQNLSLFPFFSAVPSPLSALDVPLEEKLPLRYSQLPASFFLFLFTPFLHSPLLLSAFCPISPPPPASSITSHGRPRQPLFRVVSKK